jgi:nucleotide-binding universal stress UspA family protein
MYDDILLPTDGSTGMEKVIDHAASLAAEHDAILHALYVVDTASLMDIPMEASMDGISQALEREGESALEQVKSRTDDASVETDLIEGSPAREITGYAAENPCDLVVMGTHGRSGMNRLLLGSVAERVVRSAPVPVLTVNVEDAD